ncbi:hypothetical protein [Umezawaea sp. Da 62-37]|uniref:hypothetical protein n=1 Tax=Umezawaea sp. Da 62-37 TaxID=3075927 RepID=UPI0028F6D561|nr:hypothetical protein [Umezawaea sp. Da 62-37]WNV87688.1 hypothetical protein RM788_05175 [Umezawaea sp. Da 62-37]
MRTCRGRSSSAKSSTPLLGFSQPVSKFAGKREGIAGSQVLTDGVLGSAQPVQHLGPPSGLEQLGGDFQRGAVARDGGGALAAGGQRRAESLERERLPSLLPSTR